MLGCLLSGLGETHGVKQVHSLLYVAIYIVASAKKLTRVN